MSGPVQLQSDIGGLGVHALGAFSGILATLSADNVAPMAMVQLEKLGSALHVSGKFAGQVPDLLRRFSSRPLGRLAVTIGWRKGDSASLLADTAGGQAGALLSIVLANLFSKTSHWGEVLSQLSSRLLPGEFRAASVSQLAEVADLLANKLLPLGFGNFLPEQVIKIHHAYEGLGMKPPEGLLEPLTVDAASDLLYSISKALCEEETIARVSGSYAMGHVFGLVLFMFPRDTLVTLENIVIHEGERQKVHLQLHRSSSSVIEFRNESIIDLSRLFASTQRIENSRTSDYRTGYKFTWPGWTAKRMQLLFLEVGSTVTQDVMVAFCNLVVALVTTNFSNAGYYDDPNRFNCLKTLLEPSSDDRVKMICQTIALASPTSFDLDLRTAYSCFVASIEAVLNSADFCSCQVEKCRFDLGWRVPSHNSKTRTCQAHLWWATVGCLLNAGVFSLFINARSDTSLNFSTAQDLGAGSGFAQSRVGKLIFQNWSHIYCKSTGELYRSIMRTPAGARSDQALALSHGTTTYPNALETMQLSGGPPASFELLDGQINFQGRYYHLLASASSPRRPNAKKSIVRIPGSVTPSSMGRHASLLTTVRETATSLEIQVTARFTGTHLRLDLLRLIQASFTLKLPSECSHPKASPLPADSLEKIVLTSVAMPLCSKKGAVAIAMTQSDPTAQLLCCEAGARMMLMRDCCLDCALQQALEERFDLIIVS